MIFTPIADSTLELTCALRQSAHGPHFILGQRGLPQGVRLSEGLGHRLSTIERADRIVALDHGRVAESGTHAELLAHEGIYARLYRTQFSEQGTVSSER